MHLSARCHWGLRGLGRVFQEVSGIRRYEGCRSDGLHLERALRVLGACACILRSSAARCTDCRQISGKPLSPTSLRKAFGPRSPHWRVMNGSAGSRRRRKRRPGNAASRSVSISCAQGCAGRVAGPDVHTVEVHGSDGWLVAGTRKHGWALVQELSE